MELEREGLIYFADSSLDFSLTHAMVNALRSDARFGDHLHVVNIHARKWPEEELSLDGRTLAKARSMNWDGAELVLDDLDFTLLKPAERGSPIVAS